MTKSAKEKVIGNNEVTHTAFFVNFKSRKCVRYTNIMMRIRSHCILLQNGAVSKDDFHKNQLPGLKRMIAKLPKSMAMEFINAFQSYEAFMKTTFTFPNDKPTNTQQGLSDYKLHISLSSESYDQHHSTIVNMLETALKQNLIDQFKHTDKPQLMDQLESETSALQTATEEDRDQHLIHQSRTKRLINGDQFTIYIPVVYDRDAIFKLCADINNTLIQSHAIPGKFAESESLLTPYISLRQDTLKEEYIEATNTSLKPLQEKSPIFEFLQSRFEPNLKVAHARLYVMNLREQKTNTNASLDDAIARLCENLTIGINCIKSESGQNDVTDHFAQKQSEIETDLCT